MCCHALHMSTGAWICGTVTLRRLNVDTEAKRTAIDAFHGPPSRCTHWFGRFPSYLVGPAHDAQRYLTCLNGSACESEHASVRRVVDGFAGLADNVSLVGLSWVLGRTRAVHSERMHQDLRDADEHAVVGEEAQQAVAEVGGAPATEHRAGGLSFASRGRPGPERPARWRAAE